MQRVGTTVPRGRGIRAASGPSTPGWRPSGGAPVQPCVQDPPGAGRVGRALAQPDVITGDEGRTAAASCPPERCHRNRQHRFPQNLGTWGADGARALCRARAAFVSRRVEHERRTPRARWVLSAMLAPIPTASATHTPFPLASRSVVGHGHALTHADIPGGL